MRISWILWWVISIIELLSFIGFSVLLWLRDVDASGAVQTTELKWINMAVLAGAYIIPLVIQIAWLIINLIYTNKQKAIN
ncbi:DUF3923 family protein [Staphylococcus pseudintermedius]|nr:DUF3923 family protein [Staphylococcus pseudintermedius]EGQ4427008.1 DUF3923 family protein [Staphylococcus pseudintermedius]